MSLWFVVPAYGRVELTRVCLRLLAETCATLTDNGLEASAVVVADDENLDTARELGFGTVERDNLFVGCRFNDGYEFATSPRRNPRPVDYVIPFGSDDWIHPWLLLDVTLPKDNQILCFSGCAVVSEDGRKVSRLTVPFAGVGVRVIPAALLKACGYRPAPEDMDSGLDKRTLDSITKANRNQVRLNVVDNMPMQIVDWKSDTNIHDYDWYKRNHRGGESEWDFRCELYPDWALQEMRAVYERKLVTA